MATKSKRIRDFKQEYLARIARGLASGKTRSQARGHARAGDLPHASPTVTHDAASDIGRRWVAINKFLETNDPSHLEPFVGLGLRDTHKRFWPFETRPNILRKLDSSGELSFVELYRQTVQ
jgi:hypothetical protein